MAHTYITCENGHGGPNVLVSLGWEGNTNTVRCTECNAVFDVDHSGDSPSVVSTDGGSEESGELTFPADTEDDTESEGEE